MIFLISCYIVLNEIICMNMWTASWHFCKRPKIKWKAKWFSEESSRRLVQSVYPFLFWLYPQPVPPQCHLKKWSKAFSWLQKFLHLPGVIQTWINLGPSQIPPELNSRTRLKQENTPGFKTGLNSPKSLKVPLYFVFFKVYEGEKITRLWERIQRLKWHTLLFIILTTILTAFSWMYKFISPEHWIRWLLH